MEEIMSTIPATGVSPGAATGNQPAADPPVSPTAFEAIARQVIDGLVALTKLIPAFVPEHNENKQFVKRFSGFSVESLRSMIAAVEANPELNVANKFDVQQARADLQYLDAFRAVLDQSRAFDRNVRFTYFARKARAMNPMLQTYAIGKGIGRDAASADVAAHIENIKRDLRVPSNPSAKRAKSAKKPPQTPQPPQQPQTPPQQ
jgi:hypothetical protein